jgi:hypothetical protein
MMGRHSFRLGRHRVGFHPCGRSRPFDPFLGPDLHPLVFLCLSLFRALALRDPFHLLAACLQLLVVVVSQVIRSFSWPSSRIFSC